eukprot:1377647-Amorphochlora_amoeboformis.AAC.1
MYHDGSSLSTDTALALKPHELSGEESLIFGFDEKNSLTSRNGGGGKVGRGGRAKTCRGGLGGMET